MPTSARRGARAHVAPTTRLTGASPSRRRPGSKATGNDAAPTVEVQLTWARPRPATAALARQVVAWLLLGTFGMTAMLAGIVSDPRTGELIASNLIVPLYVLAIGAFVWTAIETHPAVRRRSLRHGPSRRPRRMSADPISPPHR